MDMYSFILRDHLQRGLNPERASPYEIAYPLWIREHIHFDNPFIIWNPYQDDYWQEHEAFYYGFNTRATAHRVDFDLELKHLQDHIPQPTIREYWSKLNAIYENAIFEIKIADLRANVSEAP